MAFADLTALRAGLLSPSQPLDLVKSSTVGRNGVAPSFPSYSSMWKAAGIPAAGVTPTTAAACDRTTVGALGQLNPSSGSLYLAVRKLASRLSLVSGDSNLDGVWRLIVADRLAHIGGMDATLTTAQNTGGMGLTRNTNGLGVRAALEIYTQIGGTATTVTASYTDQDGNAGITSRPVGFGGTPTLAVGRFVPLSFALGDYGVRDVASVTLAASTAVAGNFGVTLYKPLLSIPMTSDIAATVDGDPIKSSGAFVAQVPTDACIFFLLQYTSFLGSNIAPILADLSLMEA